jgi:hypothetical protein
MTTFKQMLTIQRLSAAAFLAILLCAPTAEAQKWGTLTGRFVVDGELVPRPPFEINAGPAFPQKKLPDETVIVGKDGTLANVVVYLRAPFGRKIDVAPAYSGKLKTPAVLDIDGFAFRPHILVARVGQQIEITNSAPVDQNANISLLGLNPLLRPSQKFKAVVNRDAAIPMTIDCNVRPWPRAYIVSLAHPYVAVSGPHGKFEIEDIPLGTYEFQFWHEARGYLKNVDFDGGKTDMRGRSKIKIDEGGTDLGIIKIDAATLIK